MIDNIYKASGRICPINKAECSSRCVYADIMENIDLGIIVLDIKNKKLVFQNEFAINIFKATFPIGDYNTFTTLLLPGLDEGLLSKEFGRPRVIHHKDKLLGYTAYMTSYEYIWILIRDITEKARLESIAEEVNTMENIKYIFSSIRHELGNPTNSIKITLSVLKRNLSSYSGDTIRKYVDRALNEISRVEYLLNSLKSFGMFENPIIRNVNLPDFLDQFLSLVAEDLEKIGIVVKTTLSPVAKWVRADPRALQQVMLNLIANASDAMNDNDSPEMVISTFKRDDMICINVKDNGCGMSDDCQKNLFMPFYTTKTHGTGLGLVITRKTLARMNGRIEIKSRENIGTTATISIPESQIENR